MPRIAEPRAAAEPKSPEQQARYRRILRAASALGAERGLDRVQMLDVAKEAGVAIATLYRYFPSKTHLFASVMTSQIDHLAETYHPPHHGSAEAVADLLVHASRELLAHPRLAHAMLQANNAAQGASLEDTSRNDRMFHELMLHTLEIEQPTAQDLTLVRLVSQCWYGVLTHVLTGRLAVADAESDIRVACRLLLAPRSNA